MCGCSEKINVLYDNVYFKCLGKRIILVWGDIVEKVGSMFLSVLIVVIGDNFLVMDCMFVNIVFVLFGGVVGK